MTDRKKEYMLVILGICVIGYLLISTLSYAVRYLSGEREEDRTAEYADSLVSKAMGFFYPDNRDSEVEADSLSSAVDTLNLIFVE